LAGRGVCALRAAREKRERKQKEREKATHNISQRSLSLSL